VMRWVGVASEDVDDPFFDTMHAWCAGKHCAAQNQTNSARRLRRVRCFLSTTVRWEWQKLRSAFARLLVRELRETAFACRVVRAC
jgi:hypothetical protein